MQTHSRLVTATRMLRVEAAFQQLLNPFGSFTPSIVIVLAASGPTVSP